MSVAVGSDTPRKPSQLARDIHCTALLVLISLSEGRGRESCLTCSYNGVQILTRVEIRSVKVDDLYVGLLVGSFLPLVDVPYFSLLPSLALSAGLMTRVVTAAARRQIALMFLGHLNRRCGLFVVRRGRRGRQG